MAATEALIATRVVRTADLTPRIRLFELMADDGAELPPFGPGDHVDVAVGPDALTRSYSICNDPDERGRYLLAVLREPQGVVSGWLHDNLRAGDTLWISPPKNAFRLDENGSHHLLIAGGVGVTPIKAMAHRLAALGADFRFVFCTRGPEDTPFREELRAAFGDRLQLHHDGGDPARALDVAALVATRPPGGHVYVCGPKGLIDAVRAAARHWPTGTVHFEIFASPGAAPAEATDPPFEIHLSRSGITVTVPTGKSALDAVLDAGVDAPFVCKQGWCGNCRVDLQEGAADHRDEILTDAERAAQTQMHICVSRAAPGVGRLVIDL